MTAIDTAEAPAPPRASVRPGLPFAVVLGAITGLALMLVAKGSFRDVDVYWHILAGRELASGSSPAGIGAGWSFAPDPLPWVSTQWLGELLFHGLYEVGGWAAFAAYRTLSAALVLAILAATTLRHRPPVLAAFPYVVGVVAVAAYAQERTQQATYVGAAALGGVIVTGLVRGRLPRWWVLLPLTVVWANWHGGWILAPAALALVALGRWLDHGPRDRSALRALGLSVAALAVGALSPAGPSNITAVLRFARATDVISEWEAVTPTEDIGILSLLLWVVVLVAWSGHGRVPRSEVLATVSLFVFGWMAWRNLVVAMLMLIPLIAHRMDQAYPRFGRRPEPAWSARAGIALAAVLAALGLATVPGQPQLPTTTYPYDLAGRIAELPAGQRVLNDYNLAGIVLSFGGGATRVGIDGRTDRYGAQYIQDYTDLALLKGPWESMLDRLDPTVALLKQDAPLAHVLVAERGWSQQGAENGYVLLSAPTGP